MRSEPSEESQNVNLDGAIVRPVDRNDLLVALDSTTINYYRFFPKENMLVLPESTAREWQCETVYRNVPESVDFFAYLAEEDKPRFVDMFHQIIDGVPSASVSFRLDGFNRWCRVTMTTVARDDEGRPVEAIAIIEDRSEDMAREELNRVKNETLSFLTQVFQIAALATDATVVVFDYDTMTTTAPEATADAWGVPAEHQNGYYEIAESGIVTNDTKDAYIAVHEAMRQGADEAHAKVRLNEPDGKIGTYELVFRALKDTDGTSAHKAVGVYSDISLFEQKSEHQAAMSRALSKGINAAFFVDLDNHKFTVEEVMSDYMGKTIEDFIFNEAIGEDYDDAVQGFCEGLVCIEDSARMMDEMSCETIKRKLQTTSSYFVQYRMSNNPEGQEHFEMHVVSTDHVPGNNAFISFRCIDEQKSREVQQQLALKDAYLAAQQANDAKSEFFSRMSHDIRTPMNAIVGMTALAKTHIDDKERVVDCLSKIDVSSQHLLGLISNLLDMSKIESGMVNLNAEPFDISKLVDNLVAISQHLIEGKSHELVVDVRGIEHTKVVGDANRIQQAFINLMGNAVKYTPEGGTIRLAVTEKPTMKSSTGCYEFVFEDNGIGMTEDFLEHIFEPFARVEDERINSDQGTGLGLAIANNIVQLMNGDIKVDSELGGGSRFTATIFLELQGDEWEDEANSPSLESLQEMDFSGKRVLLVEDNELNREVATEFFEMAGLEVDVATNGTEGVDAMESSEDGFYDMVFMDIQMPVMNGYEAARTIRSSSRDYVRNVPIAAMTADAFAEDVNAARAAGMNEHIAKPIDFDRLTEVLERWL